MDVPCVQEPALSFRNPHSIRLQSMQNRCDQVSKALNQASCIEAFFTRQKVRFVRYHDERKVFMRESGRSYRIDHDLLAETSRETQTKQVEPDCTHRIVRTWKEDYQELLDLFDIAKMSALHIESKSEVMYREGVLLRTQGIDLLDFYQACRSQQCMHNLNDCFQLFMQQFGFFREILMCRKVAPLCDWQKWITILKCQNE